MPTKTIDKNDAELDEAELLKGVPALLPANQFRQRQRSAVMGFMNRLASIADGDGNLATDSPAAVDALLEILADADEFFESIAADRDAYVKWSTGLKDSESIFTALISKYARAVGE